MATVVEFDWDAPKAARNIGKHGITFEEASTIFLDRLILTVPDPDSFDEERWITIGQSSKGRLLLVIHTWNERDPGRASARLISARRPTKAETRHYREIS